ncbi:MAG TPA: hypothetical protein PL061_13480, partial [Syntrophales bacterium]|nr:hypothetical protein [Syntrophales bacterium]
PTIPAAPNFFTQPYRKDTLFMPPCYYSVQSATIASSNKKIEKNIAQRYYSATAILCEAALIERIIGHIGF